MTVIRGREAIDAARTVKTPCDWDITKAARDHYKGFVAAMYTFNHGWLFCGVHDALEDAVSAFEGIKDLYAAAPDVLDWRQVSDMVVFRNNGHDPRNSCNLRWYVCAVVIDE